MSAHQENHNVVVVPGGQKATVASSSGSSTTVGILIAAVAKTQPQNPPFPSDKCYNQYNTETVTQPPHSESSAAGRQHCPPLRPKVVTSKRGTNCREVITISDSPSPVSKPPPPLLHTPPTASTARVYGIIITNCSMQISTICSTNTASKPASVST